MLIITLSIAISRLPADWMIVLYASAPNQQQAPDNLVAFQWIAITTLCGVIASLALYIRSLLAEIRAMEKERHASDMAIIEKVTTVSLEVKEAVKDAGDAIRILADKFERQNRATRTHAKDRKIP